MVTLKRKKEKKKPNSQSDQLQQFFNIVNFPFGEQFV